MKPFLIISERDNVATALEVLPAGRELDVRGEPVVLRQTIPSGHKLAVAAIAAGESVIKYGSSIGRATAAIVPGDHVHIHNVESRRGRGDLQ